MNVTEGQTNNPPSTSKLVLYTLGAAAVATFLSVAVVLPAEFGRDPTGIGELTGLKMLGTGSVGLQTVAHDYDAPFRSDVLEIPFVTEGDGSGFYELEYKVRMKAGQTLIYSWVAEGAPADQFYFDLHSETPPPASEVIEFKQETGLRSNGALVAPTDGVHGWYWQNRSPNRVRVRLRIAGFYELIPPGENGNKAGIVPVVQTADPPLADPPVEPQE